MPLLGASQEVAKKDAKAFPLGSPLALPLFKEGLGEKHIRFHFIARREVTTSGRRGKQNILWK
jgi:hypothetical protein